MKTGLEGSSAEAPNLGLVNVITAVVRTREQSPGKDHRKKSIPDKIVWNQYAINTPLWKGARAVIYEGIPIAPFCFTPPPT